MRFCQQLNAWMVLTDCRASELCARSGVAAPSLSRYRSGERTPGRDSAAMDGLCRALAALAEEKGVSGLTEHAFAQFPPSLPLSGLFYGQDVPYTYEAYLAHLAQTEAFAAEHPRYELEFTGSGAFRNLQICIHEGQWAMVSKSKAPAIHFVIRHPKLRSAIESFIPPVTED